MKVRMPSLASAARLVLALSVATISILSVIHVSQQSNMPFIDKIEHAAAFAWLAACAHLAYRNRERLNVVVLSIYGMAIECVQWWLPWREFSLLDWVADVAGIMLWLVLLRSVMFLCFRTRTTGSGT
jgi:VanZ family protein